MKALRRESLIKYKDKLINGKLLSEIICKSIKKESTFINKEFNIDLPQLKIIQIGNKPDSTLYVSNKIKQCENLGWKCEWKQLNSNINIEELELEIVKSNNNTSINGIIIQLPLPIHLEPYKLKILSIVNPLKDIDGLNPLNAGNNLEKKNHISINEVINIEEYRKNYEYHIDHRKDQLLYEKIEDKNLFCMVPPTALGVVELLRLALYFNNSLSQYEEWAISSFRERKQVKREFNLIGYDCTVLGRSIVAGLPISILLEKLNSTVTVCHAMSKDVNRKSKKADILVSAVGKHNLVNEDYIKKDAIVIDVGINIIEDINERIICGDTDFLNIIDKVKYITPVPNGVGKMTVIMLLNNLLKAWKYQNKIYI